MTALTIILALIVAFLAGGQLWPAISSTWEKKQ